MRAIVAAPAARAALQPGRCGRVVLTSGAAGYLQFGEDFILLCSPRAPVGPLSVIVAGLRASHVTVGAEVRCDGGRLLIADVEIDLRDASTVAARPAAAMAGAPAALAAALAAVPPPPAGLRPGLRALGRGRLGAAVQLLAGLGEGLTPAGDDVLGGYAAWRHADLRPVEVVTRAAPRTTPLSLAYLRRAEMGELPDPAARVRDAIRAGRVQAACAAAVALATWGASSGFALLWGMTAAAQPTTASGLRPL